MAFKISFIPTKRRLEDADGIDSSALSKTRNIKLIGKGDFASAVLAKHNEEEVVLKGYPFETWKWRRKETYKGGQNSEQREKSQTYNKQLKRFPTRHSSLWCTTVTFQLLLFLQR